MINFLRKGKSGGSSITSMKKFSTIEEMQLDTSAKENDKALVYRSEIQNMNESTETQYITFPETVTLPSAFTDNIYTRLRAVDSSKMFDGNIMFDSSSFRFDGWSDSGRIRVNYSSSDGITYVRNSFSGDNGDLTNPVDLGTVVKGEEGNFNDTLGYFMQVGGNVFEGIYKYKTNLTDTTKFRFLYLKDLKYKLENYTLKSVTVEKDLEAPVFEINKILKVIEKFKKDTNNTSDHFIIFLNTSGELCFMVKNSSNYISRLAYSWEGQFLGLLGSYTNSNLSYSLCKIDLENENYTFINAYLSNTNLYFYYNSNKYYILPFTDIITVPINITDNLSSFSTSIAVGGNTTTQDYTSLSTTNNICRQYDAYIPDNTQLDVSSDYVYEKTFYGKNGVQTGTLQKNDDLSASQLNQRISIWNKINNCTIGVTDLTTCFRNNKDIITIPLIDTSKVTNMTSIFEGCSSLKTIPLIDTSSTTNMNSMFHSCTNLEEIPLIDTSNVTSLQYTFYKCSSLTKIPSIDTSKVINTSCMFYYCTNLKTISVSNFPKATGMNETFTDCSSLTDIPEMNTPLVNNMSSIFRNCTSLKNVPVLDLSSLLYFSNMFKNCPVLTDESLNNILSSLSKATKITSNKTLKYVGLTEAQANTCKTLSNYSAFTSAGWTTGY